MDYYLLCARTYGVWVARGCSVMGEFVAEASRGSAVEGGYSSFFFLSQKQADDMKARSR